MKKLIVIVFFSVFMQSVLGMTNKISPQGTPTTEVYPWHFETASNGVVFTLGPDDQKSLIIHVNEWVDAEKTISSDPMTVYCCAGPSAKQCVYHSYLLQPGSTMICNGSMMDSGSFQIDPQHLHHGSSGVYTFVPFLAMTPNTSSI